MSRTTVEALRGALGTHGVEVLYADRDIALLAKPSGLPTQAGRDGAPGLIELLWAGGFDGAALHHRLDQPASGVLAVALAARSNVGLAETFRSRSATRVYRAVLGAPVQDGRWDQPLEGRAATTHVAVVGTGSGYTAAELRLETGRTHQIRRHAARAGAAIVGDRRYGQELGRAWPRLALHAWRLRLRHPVTGAPLAAQAPLGADLAPLWAIAGGH